MAHFCEKWGGGGVFCRVFWAGDEKKFVFKLVDYYCVDRKVRRKMKKIFASLKKGRIFASAFNKKTGVDKNG